jgi:putative Mg2+ transporter-C (MgtC) family protein
MVVAGRGGAAYVRWRRLRRGRSGRAAGAPAHGRAADQCAGGAGGGGLRDLLGAVSGRGQPTRVAAQVVSGIGFLGAGIIFRDGLQRAGAEHGGDAVVFGGCGDDVGDRRLGHALLLTGLVVFVNLRPAAAGPGDEAPGRGRSLRPRLPAAFDGCPLPPRPRCAGLILRTLGPLGLRLAAIESRGHRGRDRADRPRFWARLRSSRPSSRRCSCWRPNPALSALRWEAVEEV